MCDTYQFRFGCDEKQLSRIFKDPEISKAFENAFMENYWLLLNRIREYKNFLQSKNDQAFITLNFDDLADENEVISAFKKSLQFKVLYRAISDVFSSEFNIKHNIIKILNSNFIKKNILNEFLLYSLNNFVDIVSFDPNLSCEYLILDDLISEFLQK